MPQRYGVYLLNTQIGFFKRLEFALKVIFHPKSLCFIYVENETSNIHQIGSANLNKKEIPSTFDSKLNNDKLNEKNDSSLHNKIDLNLHLIPNDHQEQKEGTTTNSLNKIFAFGFKQKKPLNKELFLCTDVGAIFNDLIEELKILRKNSSNTKYVPFNPQIISLLTKILEHPNATIQMRSKSFTCLVALQQELKDLSVFGIMHIILNKALQSMIKCDNKSLDDCIQMISLLIDYELCTDEEINSTTDLLISNFVSYAIVGTTILPKLLQSKQYSRNIINLDLIGLISFSYNVCSLIERIERWLEIPQELKNDLKYSTILNSSVEAYDFSSHPIEQIPFIQQYFAMQHQQLKNIVDIIVHLYIPLLYSPIPAGAIFHTAITEDLHHLDSYAQKFNKKSIIEQENFLETIFSEKNVSLESIFSLKEHYLTILHQKKSNPNSMQLEFDFEQSKQELQQINDAIQIFKNTELNTKNTDVFCSYEEPNWCAMDIFYLFLLKTYNMHPNDLNLSTFASNLINQFSVNLQSAYLDKKTQDIHPNSANSNYNQNSNIANTSTCNGDANSNDQTPDPTLRAQPKRL